MAESVLRKDFLWGGAVAARARGMWMEKAFPSLTSVPVENMGRVR